MTMCVSPVVPVPGGGDAATRQVAALRLTVPKYDALRHLKAQIEHGLAIRRRRRVRYLEDLERVRAVKAAWVQEYSDVLRQLFQGDAGGAVADLCNDWVGRVYPEYAEVGLFVEQFYEEMDYRIGRLRQVARQIAGMPEYIPMPAMTSEPAGTRPTSLIAPTEPAAAATPAATAAPAPAKPPVVDDKRVEAEEEPAAEAVVSGLLVVHPGVSSAGVQQPVERFLRDLGMEVFTLPPAPREGKSAVAALERHPNAGFAIVLLGRDDPGTSPDATFELGYFVGRLGLPRVCVLRDGGAAPEVDAHGIACLPLDAAGGWHLQLARHLKRAGIEVDLNKLC